MKSSCLKHALTDSEREQFNKDGYLIIKNALEPDKVADYTNTIKKMDKPPGVFFLNTFIQDETFLDVADNPKILPKIWGILGWNIYIQHSHLSLTPFCGNKNDHSLDQWHQDGGRIPEDVDPYPLVSVKVGYSLTSTLKPRMGSLLIVPGSHRTKGLPNFKRDGIEILANAGDATIFDQRIWHAPGSNCCNKDRVAMFCAYSLRWMRPHDTYNPEFVESLDDPIRKQLLGHHGARDSGYSYYSPNIDDVPLWEFFLKHKIN